MCARWISEEVSRLYTHPLPTGTEDYAGLIEKVCPHPLTNGPVIIQNPDDLRNLCQALRTLQQERDAAHTAFKHFEKEAWEQSSRAETAEKRVWELTAKCDGLNAVCDMIQADCDKLKARAEAAEQKVAALQKRGLIQAQGKHGLEEYFITEAGRAALQPTKAEP